MRQLQTGQPVWDLQYDEKGALTAPAQADFLNEVASSGVTDLFAFSHGWNSSQDRARSLYDTMFPMIRDAAKGAAGLGKLGFAGIYWPSLWFPPTPATPPPPAGSAQADAGAAVDLSAGTQAVSGAEIAASLRPGFADPGQQNTVTQIGQLIDDGVAMVGTGATEEAKEQQVTQISQLLRSLLPPAAPGEVEDSGESALMQTTDPKNDYQATAAVFGTAPAAGAEEGIGDWFSAAINGAKDAVRVFSYTVMKARAGTVGRTGLGPLLAALHAQQPAVRVHLIGHSFGARLVSFALAGVGQPQDSPIASLLLVEGAFSHWSFAHAQDNPFGSAGALNAFGDRVHGPKVATFSVYDWAVGIWYPKASFLSGQDTEAVVADRWGGMGADGFQAVNPAEDRTMPAQGGLSYGFKPDTYYRVNAAAVIDNTAGGGPFSGAHSDIEKSQVAQLAVAAAIPS